MEQTGEHLQCRGLAGTVRTEKADDLAGFDAKADTLDRDDRTRLAVQQALQRCAQARLAHGHVEHLAQVLDYDNCVALASCHHARQLVGAIGFNIAVPR